MQSPCSFSRLKIAVRPSVSKPEPSTHVSTASEVPVSTKPESIGTTSESALMSSVTEAIVKPKAALKSSSSKDFTISFTAQAAGIAPLVSVPVPTTSATSGGDEALKQAIAGSASAAPVLPEAPASSKGILASPFRVGESPATGVQITPQAPTSLHQPQAPPSESSSEVSRKEEALKTASNPISRAVATGMVKTLFRGLTSQPAATTPASDVSAQSSKRSAGSGQSSFRQRSESEVSPSRSSHLPSKLQVLSPPKHLMQEYAGRLGSANRVDNLLPCVLLSLWRLNSLPTLPCRHSPHCLLSTSHIPS
eukprot:m.258727 g.258727  ORF g.258727 m.258727 type:complete len:308 (-) comp54579_c0_seq6:1803-2726(-)